MGGVAREPGLSVSTGTFEEFVSTVHVVISYEKSPMALIPIKTASTTGYCDCVCGCYELASLRDEETGKGYCPACGKEHLDWNAGVGIPTPAPVKVEPNSPSSHPLAPLLPAADPPARLR